MTTHYEIRIDVSEADPKAAQTMHEAIQKLVHRELGKLALVANPNTLSTTAVYQDPEVDARVHWPVEEPGERLFSGGAIENVKFEI